MQGAGYHDEVRGLEHVGRIRGPGQDGITQGAGHDEDVQNREVQHKIRDEVLGAGPLDVL